MNFGLLVKAGCSLTVWVEIIAMIIRLIDHYLRYRLLKEQKRQQKPTDEKRGS